MRIMLIITRSDTLGGAQVHVRDLALHLLQRADDVTVLVGQQGPFTEELESAGVPFRCLRNLVRPVRPFKDLRAIVEIRRAVAELKPDLIAAHSSKAGWLARIAGRSLRVPVVFTAHGWAFTECGSKLRSRFYALAESLVAPLASRIITVSEYDREIALRFGVATKEKMVAVHNGILDVPTSCRADPTRIPPRLVMVARFSAQKDHATLIKVLSGLQNLEWEIDFVGDGPFWPKVEQLIVEAGIGRRVRFWGLRTDVAEFLAGAQLFLLISNCEGLPLSILEAMRAGLPVIASRVGGVSEAVRESETGFLIPRGDGETLRKRLIQLITDAPLRKRMGLAGRARYEAEFKFEHMFERIADVYADVQRQALSK
jgi:glycosyltransferase involved in cell wall biosynthesis